MVISPWLIPTVSCSTLATGARQFVVHEAFETTSCLAGSYACSKLTPSATVTSGAVAGAEISDLLGAGGEVLGGVLAIGEQPGRLDHDVRAELAPGERRRVLLGEEADLRAVDDESPWSSTSTSPGNGP